MHKNAFKIQNITHKLRLLWTSLSTLQLTYIRLFSTFISRKLLQPGIYLPGKNFLVITSTFPSIWFYFLGNPAEFRKGHSLTSYFCWGRFLPPHPTPTMSIVVGTCGLTHIFRSDSWIFYLSEKSVLTSWKVLTKPSWTCILLANPVARLRASGVVWYGGVKAPTTHLTCFYCTTLWNDTSRCLPDFLGDSPTPRFRGWLMSKLCWELIRNEKNKRAKSCLIPQQIKPREFLNREDRKLVLDTAAVGFQCEQLY